MFMSMNTFSNRRSQDDIILESTSSSIIPSTDSNSLTNQNISNIPSYAQNFGENVVYLISPSIAHRTSECSET